MVKKPVKGASQELSQCVDRPADLEKAFHFAYYFARVDASGSMQVNIMSFVLFDKYIHKVKRVRLGYFDGVAV